MPLHNGDWLYDQFWDTKCVKVTAFAAAPGGRKGFTPINGVHNVDGGAARVFDTGNKTNCDADLMTPNKYYPGWPGKTCNDCCGGGPYMMKHTSGGCQYLYENGQKIPNPYKNDEYLGNVLVIQEKRSSNEMNSCPDDTGRGGYIMFEFCQPVTVNAGRLLDVDGAESADISFHYADGSSTTYDVGTTGDNGYWRYDYEEANVTKVVFEYTGSGSVEGVEYWYCPDTEAPTPSPTKNPTGAPTEDEVQNAPPAGCPEVNFDFSDLSNGDWLHDQFWDTKCVKVTAFAAAPGGRKGFTPINGVHNVEGGAARVFDTGNKTNCDADLMTPNKYYPGWPGKTCNDCCGGGPYMMKHTSGGCQYLYENGQKIPNPYKNDEYLGNVLVIQEKRSSNEMNSCPDDTGRGGYIMFEFCQPVTVNAGRLLDVDGA
ncbi:MAG: hypothetical protein SGARI_001314, partial [Bacillariaceae sp.]